MRFANVLMSSPETHKKRLADMVTRSERNQWAESMEPLIREMAPFPTSYDVAATQKTNFAEFTYTEFAGGVFLTSQSIDINTRLLNLALQEGGDTNPIEQNWPSMIVDKYELYKEEEDYIYPETMIFTPANNAFDLLSWETVCRVCHENDDVRVKPHPLCDADGVKQIVDRVGWNKIIPKGHSGMDYMINSSEVYGTSCSELTVTAALLGKKVRNVGNFFHEADGAYYSITREIFLNEDQQAAVLNMAACEFSGLIFPWQSEEEIKTRIAKHYEKALELRKAYSPLYVMYPRNRK
jgi:hypothetical protein